MSFFTCILILLCIYCPWIGPLAFIVILMFFFVPHFGDIFLDNDSCPCSFMYICNSFC